MPTTGGGFRTFPLANITTISFAHAPSGVTATLTKPDGLHHARSSLLCISSSLR